MPELLLADGGTFGIIVFLVISFISWLLNMKNKTPDPAAQRPRRPARAAGGDGRLKNELEAFLEEVTGQPRAQPPQPSPAAPPHDEMPPPAVVDSEPRRLPVRRESHQLPSHPRPAERQPALARQAAELQSFDHSSQLGTALRQHVDEYVANTNIDRHVQSYMANEVEQSVREHIDRAVENDLGVRNVALPQRAVTARAREVISLLNSADGVRNAILLTEILGRPKSLR